MLSAQNITYKIGNKTLLDTVSVDFAAGQLNLIIGPNGAGKSTLVKLLCHQIKPSNGSIFYDNKDINAHSIKELACIRAVLSQNIDLTFPLTVSEVVMMGRYPHFTGQPKERDKTACKEAMQLFDVLNMADRNYMSLSGGEKQRVHFARVLAQIWYPVEGQKRYLILDEPLTFLDVYYQFDFMQKIQALLQKNLDLVVIGVVHDLNLAAKFAQQIILLNNGKVLASGNKHVVLSKENIKTAYRLDPVIHQEKEKMYLFFE
jgi:iron complex transport system ATP-binding protein